MKTLAMLAGIALLSCVLPAAAQTGNQAPPSSPCQAEPDQNSNSGDTASKTGEQKPAGDLTQKLDPCDGVLKPPPTGDSMTEPAPNQGNTPIIKPGEVPPQPPKQ